MVTKKTEDKEPEEESTFEPPLQDKRRDLPRIGFGGESIKTAIISLVMAFVVIMGMGYAGGGQFVTKGEFATNLADMITVMDAAKAGLAQAQSSIATAVQAIPSTVSTQVATSVAQTTSQWTSQLAVLSDKVTALIASNQANASKITELEAKQKSDVVALTAKDTELTGKITALDTKVSGYETRIKALEDKVAQLQSSGTTTTGGSTTSGGITITTSNVGNPLIFAATTSQYFYSLSIVNSSGVYKKVRIQILATPSAIANSISPLGITGVSATFTVPSGIFTDTTFWTTVMPPTGTITGIASGSNGYAYIGTGTTNVVITLTYSASGAYGWDMAFSPIVIP